MFGFGGNGRAATVAAPFRTPAGAGRVRAADRGRVDRRVVWRLADFTHVSRMTRHVQHLLRLLLAICTFSY